MGTAPIAHVHRVAARQYGYLPTASEGIESPIVTYLWFIQTVLEEGAPAHPLPTPKRRPKKAGRHKPHGNLHTQLYCISGVDLTRIDGIEVLTAQTLSAEVGVDMHRCKTDTHFACWLG